ncbi:hypothetical protein CF641_38190, partial [Burkholderia pseudomallei]
VRLRVATAVVAGRARGGRGREPGVSRGIPLVLRARARVRAIRRSERSGACVAMAAQAVRGRAFGAD